MPICEYAFQFEFDRLLDRIKQVERSSGQDMQEKQDSTAVANSLASEQPKTKVLGREWLYMRLHDGLLRDQVIAR